MQAPEPTPVVSAINVTPLVDVVLVLLIIFMVIAPQLYSGPEVELPTTEKPPSKADDGRRLQVALGQQGVIFIDDEQVAADAFFDRIVEAGEAHPGREVAIKGDARLTFGEVWQAMQAVEAAGFRDVGLMARKGD